MAKKQSSNDINSILRKASEYSDDLKFNKALKEYDKALKIKPKYVEALLSKGELLFGLNKCESAIETLKKVPDKRLPDVDRKLINYLENYKGVSSGFFSVFKKESSWEYVYIEADIFKRLNKKLFDDLRYEVIRRGLVWKRIDNPLPIEIISQIDFERSLKYEFLYDFEKSPNENITFVKNNNAINVYDKILKDDENNYKILNNKGLLLLALEKFTDSINCFEKALEIKPNNHRAWFNKGFAHIHDENYTDGKKCIIQSFKIDKFADSFKNKLSKYFFDLGWSLYESNRYDDSIDCYDICIICNPTNASFYNCKAISLNDMEEYDKALECYDKALELKPADKIIINNRESCNKNKLYYLFDKGKYQECIICCDEYLKSNINYNFSLWDLNVDSSKLFKSPNNFENPANFEIYHMKSLSLYFLNKFDESIKFYNKTLDINPDDEVIMKTIDWCYESKLVYLMDKENYVGACDLCDRAIRYNPNNANFYNIKAINLEYLELFDQSLEFYEKALEIEQDPTIKNNKLNCLEGKLFYLFNCEKYEEYLNCCDEYLKINDKNSEIWNLKGVSLAFLERFEEAILCFDNAIKYSDDVDEELYGCKAFCLKYLGRFDEAIEFYDKAIEVKLNESIIGHKKTCIEDIIESLMVNKNYSDASRFCDIAIASFPKDYSFYYKKGICLVILNRLDDSIEFFNKFIEFSDRDNVLINDEGYFIYQTISYLMDNEDYLKACEICDIVIEDSLYQALNYVFKSECLKHFNKFDEALEYIDKAFKVDHEDYLDQYVIKLDYFEDKLNYLIKNGNKNETIECLNDALKLYPNHEYFINLKNELN